MASYMITYDLSQPGRNYPKLHETIKDISGIWAHITESTWIVESKNETSKDIRDKVRRAIDNNDKLVVCKLTGEGAWYGITTNQTNWLKKNL